MDKKELAYYTDLLNPSNGTSRLDNICNTRHGHQKNGLGEASAIRGTLERCHNN